MLLLKFAAIRHWRNTCRARHWHAAEKLQQTTKKPPVILLTGGLLIL